MKNKPQIAGLMISLGIIGVGTGIFLIPDPHNIGAIMAALFFTGIGVGMLSPDSEPVTSGT